ncbi:hypothetical protein SKAU_G00098310 [Synaphobranchus kaupii]|uniref:dCMP deaminase n=1 Tax=Synaphobranchus kaupii TaxID=118154 RepID=A0A9Q1FXV8_SYNKA|nr:hypothetical protein SKAU_G00098310 [Synaphobranchus kaupii]
MAEALQERDVHKYFMATALLSAQRSEDPNTQVGACIVNQEENIVGIGYNRMPNGCEGKLPWERESIKWLKNKHAYVCHAELNAIMNKTSADVKGCAIYVTLFPCNECAKLIIQAGAPSPFPWRAAGVVSARAFTSVLQAAPAGLLCSSSPWYGVTAAPAKLNGPPPPAPLPTGMSTQASDPPTAPSVN